MLQFSPWIDIRATCTRVHVNGCKSLRAEITLYPVVVTLLAWGNGAPDIFSSVAAVKGGQYTLALGGQLGAHDNSHARKLVTCIGLNGLGYTL